MVVLLDILLKFSLVAFFFLAILAILAILLIVKGFFIEESKLKVFNVAV